MISSIAALLLMSLGPTASETVVDGWLVQPMSARPVCAMTRAYNDGSSLTLALSSEDDQVQLGLGLTRRFLPKSGEATHELRFASDEKAAGPSYQIAFANPTKVESGWLLMSEPIGSALLRDLTSYERIGVFENGSAIAEYGIARSEDAVQHLRICALSVAAFGREMTSGASADTVEMPAEEAEELAGTLSAEELNRWAEDLEEGTASTISKPDINRSDKRYQVVSLFKQVSLLVDDRSIIRGPDEVQAWVITITPSNKHFDEGKVLSSYNCSARTVEDIRGLFFKGGELSSDTRLASAKVEVVPGLLQEATFDYVCFGRLQRDFEHLRVDDEDFDVLRATMDEAEG